MDVWCLFFKDLNGGCLWVLDSSDGKEERPNIWLNTVLSLSATFLKNSLLLVSSSQWLLRRLLLGSALLLTIFTQVLVHYYYSPSLMQSREWDVTLNCLCLSSLLALFPPVVSPACVDIFPENSEARRVDASHLVLNNKTVFHSRAWLSFVQLHTYTLFLSSRST